MILRIQHLIQTGQAEPDSVVVVTYTERAAVELSDRIENELGDQFEGITVSTFHGLCRKLVAEFRLSQDTGKPLIRDNDIIFLLLDRYDTLNTLTSQMFKSNPYGAVTRSFLPFFNRIRDELLLPGVVTRLSRELNLNEKTIKHEFPGLSDRTDAQEYVRQFHDLVNVYEAYQSWKDDLGVVDYSDMVVECWDMLSNDREILEKVRDTYRHIVVDEYQDNNYALNQVLGLMAGGTPSISVVGDEDQCIYSFRGANYYNVHDFKQRYGVRPGKGEIWLEENHRSTQEILDLANSTIMGDRYRTQKKLVSVQKKRGLKPVWHVGDRTHTLDEIPRVVDALLDNGYSYGDVAILCRTWNQAGAVAEALERALIPVDTFEEHFFDHPVGKDVLAWGNLLYDHTRANDALFRILKRVMGSSFAQSFFRSQEDSPLPERITQLTSMLETGQLSQRDSFGAEDAGRLGKLRWILKTLSELKKKVKQRRPADEMVWEILKATDLLKTTRRGYRHSERLALANAGRLLSLAEDFVARENLPAAEGQAGWSAGGLDRFLRYMDVLSQGTSVPEISSTANQSRVAMAVQVMTIHGSKGLEFSAVLIPFLQSGSLPLAYTPSTLIDCLPESWYRWSRPQHLTPQEEHMNEERRIFFVALTRAKHEIHLFGPETRQSLFIQEILERSGDTLEIKTMTKTPSRTKLEPASRQANLKQRLLVALNRELSSGQYDYAQELIGALRFLDQEGRLPEDFPYPQLIKELEGPAHLLPASSLQRAGWLEGGQVLQPADSQTTSPPETQQEIVLSASRAEEYARCPYKYRLSNIDKVPERKSKVQMEFGIIIHKVLEEFHAADPATAGLDYLLSLLDKHWRSEAFEYVIRGEEFIRQGKQMLADYFNYFQSNRPDVVAREARFDFSLDDLNVRITGKIDRVDREGNVLSVTDYKTGTNREKAKSSLQLALYSEALKRNAVVDVEGGPGSARLHYLRFPEEPIESHTFSALEVDKHLKTLKKVAEGIRKREFPTNKGWHCKFCDYRDFLCPAWEKG